MTARPSRRHTTRDGPTVPATCGNAHRDGWDRQAGTPSQRPKTPAKRPDPTQRPTPSQASAAQTTPDDRSAHHAPDASTSPADLAESGSGPGSGSMEPGPDHPALAFSSGRLRAHRDLSRLTRAQLATITGLPVTGITAYERGTAAPSAAVVAGLAAALTVRVEQLTGPVGADDSWEYWDVICAAMSPMTVEEIASVGTVLRRIDTYRAGPAGP